MDKKGLAFKVVSMFLSIYLSIASIRETVENFEVIEHLKAKCSNCCLRTFLFFICNKPNVVSVASHVGYVQQKPQCLWWKYSVGCRNPSQWFQHTCQQFKSVFWAIRMLVVQPCKNSFMFYKNITHFIGSTIVYVTRMFTP